MIERLRGYISKREGFKEAEISGSGFVMDGEEVMVGYRHQINTENGSTVELLIGKKAMIILLDHHTPKEGQGHYLRTYWEPELPAKYEYNNEDEHQKKYSLQATTRVSDLRYRVYPVLHYPIWDEARMYLDVEANRLTWYDDDGVFHEITYPS